MIEVGNWFHTAQQSTLAALGRLTGVSLCKFGIRVLDQRAQILKRRFERKKIQNEDVKSIEDLVALQFDSSKVWGELAGRISHKRGSVTFEPVPSRYDKLIYDHFIRVKESRDVVSSHFLHQHVEQYIQMLSSELDPDIGVRLKMLSYRLKTFNGIGELLEFDITLLESVLSSFTIIDPAEVKIHDEDFCGLFHIHPNGAPPNSVDVNQSLRLDVPMIIIIANPTSRKWETLYLITAGEVIKLSES